MKETVAECCFAATRATDRADEAVFKLLNDVLGVHDCDWTTDVYDESIEVYNCRATAEQARAVIDRGGFAKIWIHAHPLPPGVGRTSCQCKSIRK